MMFKDGEPKDFIGGFTDEASIADMIVSSAVIAANHTIVRT
jgi:hypothetical protein